MARPLSRRLDQTYRTHLAAVRDATRRLVEAAYDEIDMDDYAASFEVFMQRAAPLIAAGQETAQSLARAFITSYVAAETGAPFQPLDVPSAAGTNRDGLPLTEALGGIVPLVLGGIAAGRTVEEARGEGLYLVTRLADNEVVTVADREIDAQSNADEIVGWEGIVSAGACDGCQSNSGEHSLDEEMYRHGSCACSRRPVVRKAS